MTTVAICVSTYRREEMLDDLLSSLTRSVGIDASVQLVIVDNDPLGSATSVVKEYADRLDIRFAVEPTRSISAVRNTCLRIALELRTDLIAFLDDDQLVDEQWFAALMSTVASPGVEAATGPVVSVIDADASHWARRGEFFTRPRYPTGTRVITTLPNLVISSGLAAQLSDHPFGRHFVRPGGEDTHFLRRLAGLGVKPVWCEDAIVYERVPTSRVSVGWLLTRHLRFGRAYSECLRLGDASSWRLGLRAATCSARIIQGFVLLPIFTLRGRAGFVRAAGASLSGLGGLVGLVTAIR